MKTFADFQFFRAKKVSSIAFNSKVKYKLYLYAKISAHKSAKYRSCVN